MAKESVIEATSDPVARCIRHLRELAPGGHPNPELLAAAREEATTGQFSEEARRELDLLMTAPDPRTGLSALFVDRLGGMLIPEVAALDMDQGDRKLHKDNLAHSITVCAQAPPRLRLRWACLLHDVGKAPTRRVVGTKVTFYNHESVGRRLTKDLLTRLGYPRKFVTQVACLVQLSGRTHGFDDTWTDAALRRVAVDAGGLLDDLLDLSRADCTSRRPGRREEVLAHVDAVAARLADVVQRDAQRSIRPALNGDEIMELLRLDPGPEVGKAYRYLLDFARNGVALEPTEARRKLSEWWADQ